MHNFFHKKDCWYLQGGPSLPMPSGKVVPERVAILFDNLNAAAGMLLQKV